MKDLFKAGANNQANTYYMWLDSEVITPLNFKRPFEKRY